MAVGEYEDGVALRYAGSLPDGTDVEFTVPPYGAARPYRVHPPLGDVVAEQGETIKALYQQHRAHCDETSLAKLRTDGIESRLAHVERLLHQRLNCPHCTDDYGNEVRPKIQAPQPSVLTAAERTELEALRAFPRDAFNTILAEYENCGLMDATPVEFDDVRRWMEATA